MKLLDFLTVTNFEKSNELEKAKLLCFYHYKETSESLFTLTLIKEIMGNCGHMPNMSRLKKKWFLAHPNSFVKLIKENLNLSL
ncbi:hypothetical protein A5865_003624 [Enterococcus sp. 12E11_DIV0728]|nr:hypothetical protein A5865_003624 [Enterococcus sp. 12E11_DIV0728]